MSRSSLAAFLLHAILAGSAAHADGDAEVFVLSDLAGGPARILLVDPCAKAPAAGLFAKCRARFRDAWRRRRCAFSPNRGCRSTPVAAPIAEAEPPPPHADAALDGPVESTNEPCLGCGRVVRPAPVKVWVQPESGPATPEVEQ